MFRKAITGSFTLVSLGLFAFVGAGMFKHAAGADQLWTNLTYEEAKSKAAEENRILLVYATASWCGPCKHMERTTWADPKVAAWFNEHGVAFKFDVDEYRELSRSLRVQAMPTLFAYRESELFDRVVGARGADDLITWLDNVKQGISEFDRMRELADKRAGDDGQVDVQERLKIARALAQGGEVEKATEEYLWLWDNMLDHKPSMVGVRGSFMITDMNNLARRHPPAREAFRQRRAQYWPAIEAGTASRESVSDWITLAEPAGETDSILQWFDQAKEDPKQRELFGSAERLLRERLIAAGRWRDLAALYTNPVQQTERQLLTLKMVNDDGDEEFHEDLRNSVYRMTRRNVSVMYAALLAGGDQDNASTIAAMLLKADDSPEARQALASTALNAGQPRLIHLQWLDEAIEQGHHVRQLRKEIAAALADSHT